MSKATLGVDFGARSLKLALWDGSAVRQLVSEPTPDKLVVDGHISSPEAAAAFLKETVKKYRLSAAQGACVVPADQCFVRRATVPAMTVEQLELNLPYEFRDFISEEKDKFVYDYAVVGMKEDEAGEKQLDLMAAAASLEGIQTLQDTFRWAKVKLTTAIPVELCYVNLLRHISGAAEDPVWCYLDLGHSAVRLYIYIDGAFEVCRVLDFGGSLLDRAIAEAKGEDEHIARVVKEANQDAVLDLEACQELYRSVALEVMRALNFYSYNNRAAAVETIWLGGGGSRVQPLVDQLRETLEPEIRLAGSLPIKVLNGEDLLPECLAALGAAMQ